MNVSAHVKLLTAELTLQTGIKLNEKQMCKSLSLFLSVLLLYNMRTDPTGAVDVSHNLLWACTNCKCRLKMDYLFICHLGAVEPAANY